MLTNQQISELFKVPLGTVCSWGSNRPSAARPLLYAFLKVIPSKDFAQEILNRKNSFNFLDEKQIEALFGCKKTNNLDLLFKFINSLNKEEVEELLKRAKIFMFLFKNTDLNNSIDDIFNNFSLQEELRDCDLKVNRVNIINGNLLNRILEYVKNVREKDPYRRVTATEVAKKLDIRPIIASKYLNILEQREEIPISTEKIVEKAIDDLKKQNKKITIKNIQEITGLGFVTIQRILKKLRK